MRFMLSSRVNLPPALDVCSARRPSATSNGLHVSVSSSGSSKGPSPSSSQSGSESVMFVNVKDIFPSFWEVIDDTRLVSDQDSFVASKERVDLLEFVTGS